MLPGIGSARVVAASLSGIRPARFCAKGPARICTQSPGEVCTFIVLIEPHNVSTEAVDGPPAQLRLLSGATGGSDMDEQRPLTVGATGRQQGRPLLVLAGQPAIFDPGTMGD